MPSTYQSPTHVVTTTLDLAEMLAFLFCFCVCVWILFVCLLLYNLLLLLSFFPAFPLVRCVSFFSVSAFLYLFLSLCPSRHRLFYTSPEFLELEVEREGMNERMNE